jgi:hypothetical protein
MTRTTTLLLILGACQAAPAHTRTECAKKATCSEVVQCLE